MPEKSRGPRRPAGAAPKPRSGGRTKSGPRPTSARAESGRRVERAGASASTQAVKRTASGGLQPRDLEILEREGLLTAAGQRLRTGPEKAVKAVVRTVGKPKLTPSVRKASQPAERFTPAEAEVAQRLHKVMARAGVASRRHSEELIQAGRVTVNGHVVTELGTKIVPGKDIVELDGRPMGRPESMIYVIMNKPKGYVTTMYDPQNRPKVLDLLGGKIAERVYPVGRLDYDTEGLLLLTNDGDLANAIMHPARKVTKTYIAKLRGVPGPAKLAALERGIELDDGPTAPAEVKMLEVRAPNGSTLSIRIHEGRNRQVRRMFELLGHEVIHLRRTTIGPLQLDDLPLGAWRELTEAELEDLKRSAGVRGRESKAWAARKPATPKPPRRPDPVGKVGARPRAEGGIGRPARTLAAPGPRAEGGVGRPTRTASVKSARAVGPGAVPARERQAPGRTSARQAGPISRTSSRPATRKNRSPK